MSPPEIISESPPESHSFGEPEKGKIEVQMGGGVIRYPGTYYFDKGTKLSEAFEACGGMAKGRYTPASIRVLRVKDGEKIKMEVDDGSYIKQGIPDFTLEDGDRVLFDYYLF